jgi:trehalose 6-phosphate phosphatase
VKHWEEALPDIDSLLRRARRILIASDFDGTLCPLIDSAADVRPAGDVIELVRRLGAHPDSEVAIITGRSLTDVRPRVPVDVAFAGNHGLEIAGKGLAFEHPEAARLRPVLKLVCEALDEVVAPWPEAWMENKGLSATLHYRSVQIQYHDELTEAAAECMKRFPQFQLHSGVKSADVLPNVAWDKGFALDYLCRQLGPFQLAICMGDSAPDEAMFRANSEGVNLHVGINAQSAATYFLPDSYATGAFLLHVATQLSARVVPR